MLVDAAFGSAQLARAGARGLGVGGVVFLSDLYQDKFSGHLHEVKQAETVHHKLLLFITTQLDVLVQPAPLRFPPTAEFALVFALPCRAIPCWEPDL